MRHTSHIRVDLDAVAGNLHAIRHMIGSRTQICSVVKADAYGLGARRVVRTLIEAGSQMLAVFTPAQAAEIEDVSADARILVLMPTRELPRDPAIARMLAAGRLELVVTELQQLASLSSIRLGRALPVHVEIDSGMGRGGAHPDIVPTLFEGIRQARSLRLRGVFTHFSSNEPDVIAEQSARFDQAVAEITDLLPPRVQIHTASTGPCFTVPEERRDIVRIGMGWTGSLPGDADGRRAASFGLRGAVSWSSSLIQVRDVKAGATVGYGSRWTTPRATRLGLIPVGYADGYPATCVNTEDPHRVLVELRDGFRAVPVVGMMNMDQLVVDLGDLDPSEPLDQRGVVLISEQQDSLVSLSRVAARAGIVPHQLLACLGPSVPRTYLAEGGGMLRAPHREQAGFNDRSATAAG
jgi:alanine racemase